MGTPQIVLIALWAIDFGIAIAKHGQPKKENHSGFVTAAAIAINVAVLTWGGFFN